jgi:hypothetical protein
MVLESASHLSTVTRQCHNRGGAKQLYGFAGVVEHVDEEASGVPIDAAVV